MSLSLESLRGCFDGGIPGVLATCSPAGVPNVAYLSQVQYIDRRHIALTYQFFNKTRANILANPRAVLSVTDPMTAESYRLSIRYLHTETSGPVFEMMRAKLSGIAAHTGMADVFRLLGADIYEVSAITQLPTPVIAPAACRPNPLPALRRALAQLKSCADLDSLINGALNGLVAEFNIQHAMILLRDATRGCLYTVASGGYDAEGIGSEIPIGHGVIGIAARERTPIRIAHMTHEYGYGKAIRTQMEQMGLTGQLETAIPMPGLAECRSQMAIPVTFGDDLIGVMYVESTEDLRFGYNEEDALMAFAAYLGSAMRALDMNSEPCLEKPMPTEASARHAQSGAPVHIRHFARDHSIFVDDDYLIKGVAGAILWHLTQTYQQQGRDSFSNRELRLQPELGLPELGDNLEARLVLLKRRLNERKCGLRIEPAERGRFHLVVNQPLILESVRA